MSRVPIVVEDSGVPKALSLVIDIWGITLWPFVLVRGKIDPFTLRHETIHIRQQAELLVLPFYVLYLGFWLYRWVQLGDKRSAYFAIPFEREAYSNQEEAGYLSSRTPFSWIRYIDLQSPPGRIT
jgi:hypothetical protein